MWVRIGQRYCGPCFRLARWFDDHRALLEQDYVLLKIDNVLDRHGLTVARRLTNGENHGVPFHGIFTPAGTLLIDSAAPLGNIGSPSGPEGRKHLQKMLLKTRRNLPDEEVEELVRSTDE